MADTGGQFILVKKADGTFERRSLAEIKKMKAGANPAPVVASVKPVVIPKKSEKALLEETLPKNTTSAPLISVPRDAQADEIIKKVSFAVTPSVLNRLRTLIQLRIKDIRSSEQTKEALLRSEKDGGVGLTIEQTKEILALLPNEEMLIPHEDFLPATSSPVNAFKAVPVQKPVVTMKTVAPAQPQKPAAPVPTPADKQKVIDTFVKNNPEESFFKLAADLKPKPMMQDITAKNTPMGPTDEIRYFTLTDFRRLSGNPEEAAMRFKQKFVNLRDESILLYLDAVAGWKTAPLYLEYVTSVINALAKKTRLGSEVDPKKISVTEMQAIITMERQLDYL